MFSVSKDDEAFSPLISPSKRVRTPRTSGARRLERLELEGADADATQQDRVVDDDEPKVGGRIRWHSLECLPYMVHLPAAAAPAACPRYWITDDDIDRLLAAAGSCRAPLRG